MTTLDFGTVMAIGVHDMKNSLGRMVMMLDELASAEMGRRYVDDARVAKLQYEARRMKDNLVRILTLYRSANDLYRPHLADLSVYELLEDCWLNNKPLMDQQGVTCELDCADDLHWILDGELIGSLIENVLTNTVRYTSSSIRISAYPEDDWLNLIIADDGVGFPPDMLGPRGLDDAAAPDARLGQTGLGLYFCAWVADCHRSPDARRGRIALRNGGSLGGGEFLLTLPALA